MNLRSVCHQHPVYAAGCPECREYGAARGRTRNRLIAYGQWPGMVDGTPVRAHLDQLLAGGMSKRNIAQTAGVGKTVIDRLCSGEQAQLRSGTASKILAVPPVLAPHASVSSLGASRRLQALMAAGWDAKTLAPLLGTSTNQIRRWRWQSQQTMRHDVHSAIADLYRRLADRPGSSGMARSQARRFGYHTPIHWDDDGDLDDPSGQPKGVRRSCSKSSSTSERRAA